MRDELLRNPVFAMAATQFDGVADFLGLNDELRERTKWPKRLITVTVPIRHDDGSIRGVTARTADGLPICRAMSA